RRPPRGRRDADRRHPEPSPRPGAGRTAAPHRRAGRAARRGSLARAAPLRDPDDRREPGLRGIDAAALLGDGAGLSAGTPPRAGGPLAEPPRGAAGLSPSHTPRL